MPVESDIEGRVVAWPTAKTVGTDYLRARPLHAPQRIGTAISLVSPADAMWRRTAYELQPTIAREFGSPFVSVSVPSAAMVARACAFVAAALLLAIRLFRKRPL